MWLLAKKVKGLKFNYFFGFFLLDENGVFIAGGGAICLLAMRTELFVHVDGLTGQTGAHFADLKENSIENVA